MKHCTTDKCPQILDSSCVFYEGTSLIFSGINTNDSVETVIQKLNLKLESIPVFNSNNYYNKVEVDNLIKNYIPLQGTLSGFPLIGNVEFSPGDNIKLYSNSGYIMLDDSFITLSSLNNNNISVNTQQVFLNSGNLNNRKYINFSTELDYIPLQSNVTGAGLVGENYYGNNYVDNSFVQKKFVTDTFNNIDLSNFYTKNETDLLLENYYLKTETYSKNEINDFLNSKADSSQLNNYYTKSETFSQSQINTALGLKLDKGGYTGTAQDLYTRFEGKITAGYNNIPKVGNGASGKVMESSIIDEINGKISIGLAVEASEKLEVNGNVKAIDFKGQSIKFNLQTSISPTPNTLVPKTNGSGLIWYNNSSIGSDLLFLPSEWIFGLGSGLIDSNTAIGKSSLKSNSTGENNTSIGWNALIKNTTGTSNTAIGRSALSDNVGGYSNTGIGYVALSSNVGGFRNTAVGAASQRFSTGTDNCSLGDSTLVNSGGAFSNSVFGSNSGYNCSGNLNSAFGLKSLYSCSGANNVAIGAWNAYNIGSGNKCVFVGAVDFGFSSTANATNMIAIGFNVAGKGSNTVELGNDSITNTYLKGKVNLNNRLKLASYTKTQRDALTNKEVGDMIWQTDSGNSGIRVYDGTNWLALQTTID